AHRKRQRYQRSGRQSSPEAIHANAHHDEAVRRNGRPRQNEGPRQTRRLVLSNVEGLNFSLWALELQSWQIAANWRQYQGAGRSTCAALRVNAPSSRSVRLQSRITVTLSGR